MSECERVQHSCIECVRLLVQYGTINTVAFRAYLCTIISSIQQYMYTEMGLL